MPRPSFGFSQLSKRTPESPIAYFMKLAVENRNIISLAAGLVDSDSLPAEEVGAAIEELLDDPILSKQALQYGTTQGHKPLREKIAKLVSRLDTIPPENAYKAEDVIVTTGSQQLLYLLSEILLDEGDIVLTEAPSYFVYQNVMSSRGVEVLGVPMDDDGLRIDLLQVKLQELESSGRLSRLKLIYTVDYYQNPSGRTLSLERRKQFIELLKKWETRIRPVVVEDAAYRELRFEGPDLPSLKSMDVENRCIVYAGTFSKPCAPGFKTGYAILPKELIEPILLLKGNHDFGSGNLAQYVIDRLLEKGDYAAHVLELQKVYRRKRDAMTETLSECFADTPEVTWTKPTGGMFVWLKLPEEISTGMLSDFAKAASSEGVLYVPGVFSYRGFGPLPDCEMRLAYGDAPIEQIREGIRRLKRAYESVRMRTGTHVVIAHKEAGEYSSPLSLGVSSPQGRGEKDKR